MEMVWCSFTATNSNYFERIFYCLNKYSYSSVAELQGELRRLGILAEVLEQPAALQEAV
jgi:hypothetical protein